MLFGFKFGDFPVQLGLNDFTREQFLFAQNHQQMLAVGGVHKRFAYRRYPSSFSHVLATAWRERKSGQLFFHPGQIHAS
ncbi:hypothetical protein D3C78_1728870 [compost metagenome]